MELVAHHVQVALNNIHWMDPWRVVFYGLHLPVYWGLCGALHVLGIGHLSPEQEQKNLVSRSVVAWRVLEVQWAQFVSLIALDQLGLLREAPTRWLYVGLGLLLFDLVEYVMHRIYHHRLLYKTVHKVGFALVVVFTFFTWHSLTI